MIATAHPTLPSAAASLQASATPTLELLEARQQRDALKVLLRKEQAAMADFLVALAGFDRRRGWEALGHASLFAFLVTELGLSTASTYWRKSAAELLQRFPDLERPLRDGTLCLTTMAELAKVLTQENKEAVLPRFLGISSREARELVAELQPREAPPLRDMVTSAAPTMLRPVLALDFASAPSRAAVGPGAVRPPQRASTDPDPESFRAPEMNLTHPARVLPPRSDVEPLTANLRRLHVTVSRQFLKKLDAARDGLSHAIPGASAEQVIEAALDLLLEKQARARGQVKRPRSVAPVATEAAAPPASSSTPPCATPASDPSALASEPATSEPATSEPATSEPATSEPASSDPATSEPPTTEPIHRRTGPREAIPAAVRRAVWERDRGRCQWPLDSGGRCGSTHRLELDHVVPWARLGGSSIANLRLVCHAHNARAARQAFGDRCVERYAGRRQEAP